MYRPIVRDNWETCPGKIIGPLFNTRKEALFWATREIDAAAELFADGRSKLSVEIVKTPKT